MGIHSRKGCDCGYDVLPPHVSCCRWGYEHSSGSRVPALSENALNRYTSHLEGRGNPGEKLRPHNGNDRRILHIQSMQALAKTCGNYYFFEITLAGAGATNVSQQVQQHDDDDTSWRYETYRALFAGSSDLQNLCCSCVRPPCHQTVQMLRGIRQAALVSIPTNMVQPSRDAARITFTVSIFTFHRSSGLMHLTQGGGFFQSRGSECQLFWG